jgi:fructose-1,6-bisphosphatase/inositol monophosphatase family enzyme
MTLSVLDPFDDKLATDFNDRVYETAVSAARRAGAIQMHHFRNTRMQCHRLLHDVKIETDRKCENAIIAAIRERFPDHTILSEESGILGEASEYIWIIDPLDGTVNFWHGLPFFCVSIACYRNTHQNVGANRLSEMALTTPVAGMILSPFSEELFSAIAGRGAFLNGRPIRVSSINRSADAVITVSFGKNTETMQRMTRRLEALLPQVRKVRCLGAAAVELGYLAAGFLGGLIYEGLRLWDFAAGKIIIEEAGGFLEAVETEPNQWRIIAGTPAVRDALSNFPD